MLNGFTYLQMSHQLRSSSQSRGYMKPPSSHSLPPTPAELMQTLVGTQRALAEDMHKMINDDNGSVVKGLNPISAVTFGISWILSFQFLRSRRTTSSS
jgi:hypothetical protein